MQAYEFSSVIEDSGVIHVPEQYLRDITSPVRIILLSNEKPQANRKKHFSAMKLKTKNFKFDRDIANEKNVKKYLE